MEALQIFDKHYKLFVAAIIGVILLCIGIIIAVPVIRENNKPTILEIAVAPTTAKIEIDGKEYQNGTHRIEPGEYDVKITKEGFKQKETKVKVAKGQQTILATYILSEEEGYKYFERSAADIEVLHQINAEEDAELRSFIDEYDEKMKIKEVLPINASYNFFEGQKGAANLIVQVFISDGSTDSKCHYAFCLRVTGDRKKSQREARVKEIMKANNFNYEDYEVIYD